MHVIRVRNVHQALPEALRLLDEEGIPRDSRNGPVRVIEPGPVITTYSHPRERVIFWPQRDANPALHLYESLWMLVGRNDVTPLLQFTKQFLQYSDDGKTLHGAYGDRWRRAFGRDQLQVIADRLRDNPNDRRCVLQTWDTRLDLDRAGKDVPCNVMITFQCSSDRRLNMVVFNRSNDIVWGAYGANGVHLSMLQEYMTILIGCTMGTYTQVSVNWHAYENILEDLKDMPRSGFLYSREPIDPYSSGEVVTTNMVTAGLNATLSKLLLIVDRPTQRVNFTTEWGCTFDAVLCAHQAWCDLPSPTRYITALGILDTAPTQNADWIVAMREWIQRRYDHWKEKSTGAGASA